MKAVICSLSLLCLLLSPTTTFAQSDNGALRLETSPLPVDLVTDPGKPVTTQLKIRNIGSSTETLKLGLLTFRSGGDSGAPQLRQRQPGDDFFDWVTFSPSTFTAEPFVWKTVTMTISPPPSAAFGYYYAVTFSRANPASAEEGHNALLGSTATLVLLEVRSPLAKRQLQLTGFATTQPWYEFLPVNFLVTLKNSGNIHVVPHGTIFISQAGHPADSVAVNSGQGNILPQTKRTFNLTWDHGFPVIRQTTSQGQTTHQLDWPLTHADWWRFGKYTAQLVVAYDNGTRDVPLTATTTFWIIPWRLILIALAIPLLPTLLVYLIMRWRLRRAREGW